MSDDNDGIEIDSDDIGGEIVNQMVLNKVQDLMKKIFERLAARFGVKKSIAGIIIAILIPALFVVIPMLSLTKENKIVELGKNNTQMEYSEILIGVYSVLIYCDNSKQMSKTAEIQLYKNGEYRLIMVGEYAPEYIRLTVDNEGKLISDKIGTGTISYKKELDKTTLVFTKGRYTWKLIK